MARLALATRGAWDTRPPLCYPKGQRASHCRHELPTSATGQIGAQVALKQRKPYGQKGRGQP